MATWIVEDYPGPGEYTPNIDFVKVIFPKYSIPRSTYRYSDVPGPGPGFYNIKQDIPGPFYTMAAKKNAVIKRQGPRLPPPARGHRQNYGPFGFQPGPTESMGQPKKIGQGIITMHHKQKPKEIAQIPT